MPPRPTRPSLSRSHSRAPACGNTKHTRKRGERARRHPATHSKLEPALPGRVGQGLDPAVVDVAAPVEGHLFDLGSLADLRDLLAHQLRRLLRVRGRREKRERGRETRVRVKVRGRGREGSGPCGVSAPPSPNFRPLALSPTHLIAPVPAAQLFPDSGRQRGDGGQGVAQRVVDDLRGGEECV